MIKINPSSPALLPEFRGEGSIRKETELAHSLMCRAAGVQQEFESVGSRESRPDLQSFVGRDQGHP
jgi:hypothetical protein